MLHASSENEKESADGTRKSLSSPSVKEPRRPEQNEPKTTYTLVRDKDDRKKPHLFDVVYDACCRRRYHIAVFHRSFIQVRMRLNSSYVWLPAVLVAL